MTGQYVDVNGLNAYYEVHGEGEPLLLMHGGFCTVETFEHQTPALAEHYRVYLPERRAHGRTADPGGISYDLMADDTIGFMQALGIESAHLVGFSDGANTALIVALKRPDVVRKIVSIGGNFHANGMTQQSLQYFEIAAPDRFLPHLVEAYKRLTPDGPDHFPTVFEKIIRMWRDEPSITAEELARITAPTLVLVGDRDMMTLEHTVELFRSVANGRLCILPGAHGVPFDRPGLVNQVILEFLAA
jgi:pimeloyl-ACP methyl ester carboxylesterase